MEQRYLLDANTVIYYTKNTLPHKAALFLDEQIPKGIYLSIIVRIELLGWIFPTPEAEAIINEFVNSCIVINKFFCIVIYCMPCNPPLFL